METSTSEGLLCFAGIFKRISRTPFSLFVSLSLSAVKVLPQQILPAQYEDVVGDNLINLAVVLEDMATDERVLASEEFNIAAPQLSIQVL